MFQHMQLKFEDIVCVRFVDDPSPSPVIGIFTTDRLSVSPRLPPIKLAAQTEEELENWVNGIIIAHFITCEVILAWLKVIFLSC